MQCLKKYGGRFLLSPLKLGGLTELGPFLSERKNVVREVVCTVNGSLYKRHISAQQTMAIGAGFPGYEGNFGFDSFTDVRNG